MDFISKSKLFQKWYGTCNKRYAYLHELPDWVLSRPQLRENWLQDSASVFEEHKKKRKEIIDKRNKMIKSIEEELIKINKAEDDMLTKFYTDHPIVAINKIPSQGLPGDRFLKHSGKSGEVLESALKDELDNYKAELSDRFIVNKEDIKELIKILKEVL
jgi:hypothetical protein